MKFSLLAAAAVIGLATSAQSAVIDFEEFGPQPDTFVQQDPLTDQYANLGVNFSGGWEILDESSNFGIDPISGSNFLAFNTGEANVTDTVTLTFDEAISAFAGFFGGREDRRWTLTTFLNGGQVDQSFWSSTPGSYVLISASGSFDALSIASNGTNGVADNLRFSDIVTAPVPLPASALLLIGGLGGLAALRRRG